MYQIIQNTCRGPLWVLHEYFNYKVLPLASRPSQHGWKGLVDMECTEGRLFYIQRNQESFGTDEKKTETDQLLM